MPRLQETFARQNGGGIHLGDIIIVVIISLSLISIGNGTFSVVEGTEK